MFASGREVRRTLAWNLRVDSAVPLPTTSGMSVTAGRDPLSLSVHTQGLTADGGRLLEPVLVRCERAGEAPLEKLLERGTLVVGTGPTCDLVLTDPTVSRQHVALELHAGELHVRDLGSRNGTRYLGAKVSEARVPVGGSLLLGKSTLRFLPPQTGRIEGEVASGLIGDSAPMRALRASLAQLGRERVPVLIRGETGTGKGAVARALHALGPRAAGPFVTFDCAAVHPSLLESELFGHVRGAFTGADEDRAGAIAAASGGTLFLDEIGEMTPALQVKLLRVVETQRYRRVGATREEESDFRLLSATHRDLEEQVQKGAFRSDLYHRLSVTELHLPPLRNRREDVPALALHFARQHAQGPVSLSRETIAILQSGAWPGNVRELRNAVERLLVLGTLPSEDAPAAEDASFNAARDQVLSRFERDFLVELLGRHGGNVSAAAREAKLARSQFYRLLEKHQLVGLKP